MIGGNGIVAEATCYFLKRCKFEGCEGGCAYHKLTTRQCFKKTIIQSRAPVLCQSHREKPNDRFWRKADIGLVVGK